MMTDSNDDDSRVLAGRLVRVRAGHRVRLVDEERVEGESEPVRRPARVAVMLALAYDLEGAVAEGVCEHRADVARMLGLTRARISQFLSLTLLAPDIQEEVLFMEAVDGVEPLSVRVLQPIAAMTSWAEQRRAWRALRDAMS